MNLSNYLKKRSIDICVMNECTEEEHYCESYAYIDADMNLLDVCRPDFFQGSGEPYAAIPLPWSGTLKELKEEVKEQTFEEEEES